MVESMGFVFLDFNRSQELKCTIVVPLSLNDDHRHKLRESAQLVGFSNPISVNQPLATAIECRFRYQFVFANIC